MSDVRPLMATVDDRAPAAVGETVAGTPDGALDAVAAKVARALGALGRPPKEVPPGGFGVRQRWTLTRLSVGAPGAVRILLRDTRFIDAARVASACLAPPPTAYRIDPEVGAVIDGIAAEGEMVFYALLVPNEAAEAVVAETSAAGPPWRPAPLKVLPPPFGARGQVASLGPAAARLETLRAARAAQVAADPDGALAALVAAACACLSTPLVKASSI